MMKTMQSIATTLYKSVDKMNHQISHLIPRYHGFVLTRGKGLIQFFAISTNVIAIMNFIFLYSLWWLVGIIQLALVLFYRILAIDNIAIPESTNKTIIYSALPLLLISMINTILLNPLWLLLVITNFSLAALVLLGNQSMIPIIRTNKSMIFFLLIIASVVTACTIPLAILNAINEPKVRFVNQVEPVDLYQLYAAGSANNEHVMPKEWFVDTEKVSQMNFYNDYVNVVKANEIANNSRGHLPFCMVDIKAISDIMDGDTLVGYRNVNGCFMPLDDYKGDAARIILYMYVKYKPYIKSEYRSEIDIELMKLWSHQDPVSNKEKLHNEKIREMYHYDNTLVSYPILVNYIK